MKIKNNTITSPRSKKGWFQWANIVFMTILEMELTNADMTIISPSSLYGMASRLFFDICPALFIQLQQTQGK